METSPTPFRVLPLDRGAERSVAALRLVAAAAVALGAIWIAILRPPPLVWACVALGALASLMWIVMGLRARKRLTSAPQHRLALDRDALRLSEDGDVREIAWDAIESVEVDEERLAVRVHVRGEAPLSIEPRYGGLGAYDLAEAIQRALEAARPAPEPS